MSHLGDRLSALVDGELDGAELDRAHAHLAGCERCRAEAAELRALKQKLHALGAGAPAEPASRPAPGKARSARGPRWARRRYVVIGAVSLVVGLGTAAFTVGGAGQAAPGPRITPPVDMYSVEHAITTGEVPFAGPSPSAPAGEGQQP